MDALGGADGHPNRNRRADYISHTHLCIEAALSGLGVALVEKRLIRRELDEGLLVAPWGFVPLPFRVMALPAAGRTLPRNLSKRPAQAAGAAGAFGVYFRSRWEIRCEGRSIIR